MWDCRLLACVIASLALIAVHPASAAKDPKAAADNWVEQARIEIGVGRLDVAEKHLETAIKKAPGHVDAHFLLCGVAMRRSDQLARGFAARDKVVYELYGAATACSRALDVNVDPGRRASMLGLRLRAQMMTERWTEAASTLELLIAEAPDDGRLVGAHAAVLDRAGRKDESRSALERAASGGAAFDRAARFEFVWDRFDRAEGATLGPMIARLRGEETDPRRMAILTLLDHALTSRSEGLLLEFLDILETGGLNVPELDKLWVSLAGPPPHVGTAWTKGFHWDEPRPEPPALDRRVSPRFPETERAQHNNGRVDLLVRVESDGSVGPIWVMRSTGPSFAGAAVDAVKEWRYKPATRQGKPIAYPYTIRVDFRIR